jgi:hypothetical protein
MGGTEVRRAVVSIKLGDLLQGKLQIGQHSDTFLFIVLNQLVSMLKAKLLLKSSTFSGIMLCRLLKASVLEEHNCLVFRVEE